MIFVISKYNIYVYKQNTTLNRKNLQNIWRKYMKKLCVEIKHFSIRSKIILFFIVTTVLVFGSMLFYILLDVKPRNEKDTCFLIRQNVESKASDVSRWIEKRVVEYRTLSAIPAVSSMDVREITPIIERLTDLHKKDEETMETFSFIGKNGFCWINSEATQKLIQYEDYAKAYETEDEFIIGAPVQNSKNQKVLMFYYPIRGYTFKKESLICSAVPLSRLEELVNTIQLYKGKTWIMSTEGDIITTNPEYFYSKYLPKEQLDTIDFSKFLTSDFIDISSVQGNAKLFISPISSYPNWILCTLVEQSEINRSANEMMFGCIVMLIFLVILISYIGFYLTNSVLNPIKKLQTCMKKVEEGHLDAYYPTNTSKDEIYYLGTSFNKMLDEISHLIEKIYKEQSERRVAELRTLQEQIKPHFLYNTLDNIKWMAKKQKANNVAKTITDLSTFFRVFLSNGAENITLNQEFRHTRSYLDIQKTRYGEKLSYVMELEEDLMNILVPKIIIQPIVENSIYHGIKRSDKNCTITIEAKAEGDFINISIEDDGIGIPPQKLAEIKKYLESEEQTKHYGMRNIVNRLTYAYNGLAEFKIESHQNMGTTVTIKIPKQS